MDKELDIELKIDGKGEVIKKNIIELFELIKDNRTYHIKIRILEQSYQKRLF